MRREKADIHLLSVVRHPFFSKQKERVLLGVGGGGDVIRMMGRGGV